MIVAKENIYYQNRMFKPNEPMPCYDIKMVQAWLASGVAIDTNKGVVNPTPIVSKTCEEPKKVCEEVKSEPLEEEVKKIVKIKTRSKK